MPTKHPFHRWLAHLLLLGLALCLAPRSLTAGGHAGDLDPQFAGFDADGLAIAQIGGDDEHVNSVAAVAVLADGKIVQVGSQKTLPLSGQFFGAIWWNADGTISRQFTHQNGRAHAVAIQSDGKIVIGGYLTTTTTPVTQVAAILRLHPDGRLDSSFGQGGVMRLTYLGGSSSLASAISLQPDANIVVTGELTDGTRRLFVTRLLSDGAVDNTFGTAGAVILADGQLNATALAIDGANRIIVGGIKNGYPRVWRFTAEGTLDVQFSSDGVMQPAAEAAALAILAGDRIAVGGASNGELAVAVVNPDGTPDSSYSGDGLWTGSLGGCEEGGATQSVRALVLQDDGKLTAAGDDCSDQSFIMRLTAGGNLDGSFGINGFGVDRAPGDAVDLARQPDGKWVVPLAQPMTGADPENNWLARYDTGGRLDAGGTTRAGFFHTNEVAFATALQADGKIVVIGDSESPLASNGRDVTLLRFHDSGQLDTSFGDDGRAIYEIINDDRGRDVVLQPDGKIVVAGFRFHTINDDFVLWRFNADGDLDTSFGNGGLARTGFGIGTDRAQAVVRQASGKLVIAGFSRNTAGRHWLTLTRFDADGDLDTAFGSDGNGKVVRDVGSGAAIIYDLIELQNDDLLAVGQHDGDFFALRLNRNGRPVNAFGDDGYAEYPLSGVDVAFAAAELPSGVIVLAGRSNNSFGLLLIEEDGAMCLDRCRLFSESRIFVDFGTQTRVRAVTIQADGKILLAGERFGDGSDASDFLLARLRWSPTPGFILDESFADGGKVETNLAGRSGIRSLALSGFDIIAAGYANSGNDNDFAVASYHNDSAAVPTGVRLLSQQGQHVRLPAFLAAAIALFAATAVAHLRRSPAARE